MLIFDSTTILSPFQRAFKSGCFSSASAVSLTTMSVKAIDGASPVPADRLELLPQVHQVGGIDGRRQSNAGGGLCTRRPFARRSFGEWG